MPLWSFRGELSIQLLYENNLKFMSLQFDSFTILWWVYLCMSERKKVVTTLIVDTGKKREIGS